MRISIIIFCLYFFVSSFALPQEQEKLTFILERLAKLEKEMERIQLEKQVLEKELQQVKLENKVTKLEKQVVDQENQQKIAQLVEVPRGTILPFYGGNNQLPFGFLFCNGNIISKTKYSDLYSHLVLANPYLRMDDERAQLPDLRGEFIRGWDNGRDIDLKRQLGSVDLNLQKSIDAKLDAT